jgi:hypothetical protein
VARFTRPTPRPPTTCTGRTAPPRPAPRRHWPRASAWWVAAPPAAPWAPAPALWAAWPATRRAPASPAAAWAWRARRPPATRARRWCARRTRAPRRCPPSGERRRSMVSPSTSTPKLAARASRGRSTGRFRTCIRRAAASRARRSTTRRRAPLAAPHTTGRPRRSSRAMACASTRPGSRPSRRRRRRRRTLPPSRPPCAWARWRPSGWPAVAIARASCRAFTSCWAALPSPRLGGRSTRSTACGRRRRRLRAICRRPSHGGRSCLPPPCRWRCSCRRRALPPPALCCSLAAAGTCAGTRVCPGQPAMSAPPCGGPAIVGARPSGGRR